MYAQSAPADAVSVGLNLTWFINSSFIARLLGWETSRVVGTLIIQEHTRHAFLVSLTFDLQMLECHLDFSLAAKDWFRKHPLYVYIYLSLSHSRSQSDVHIILTESLYLSRARSPPQQVARPSERFTHRILIANKGTHAHKTKYLSSASRPNLHSRARPYFNYLEWANEAIFQRALWKQCSIDVYLFIIFNVSLNFIADYI